MFPFGNTEIQLTFGAGRLEKENEVTPTRSNINNMFFNGLIL